MDKKAIASAIEGTLAELVCFLVEVSVSTDNDIEIVIEKEEGIVSWDDCAAVDHKVHETFDQDVEDYALTVSSAGLDRPFKVMKQYQKAIGTKVDVWMKGGKKCNGVLQEASEEGIVVDGNAIGFDVINSVRPLIEF